MVIETLSSPPPLQASEEIEIWSVIRNRTRVIWGPDYRIEYPYQPFCTWALINMARRCAAMHFGCADDDRLLWIRHDPAVRNKAGKCEPTQPVKWFARYPDYEHVDKFAQYNLNDLL